MPKPRSLVALQGVSQLSFSVQGAPKIQVNFSQLQDDGNFVVACTGWSKSLTILYLILCTYFFNRQKIVFFTQRVFFLLLRHFCVLVGGREEEEDRCFVRSLQSQIITITRAHRRRRNRYALSSLLSLPRNPHWSVWARQCNVLHDWNTVSKRVVGFHHGI